MINLLPFFYKEELERDNIYKIALNLMLIFCFFSISLTLVFLAIYFHLKGKLDVLQTIISIQERSNGEDSLSGLKGKILDISKTISEVKSFYDKQIYATIVIEKIFNSLPTGIVLTSFSWQKEGGNIMLSGIASTRQALFDLKSNLELAPEFSDVEFPPQNWIKATAIDFQTTFKIKHQ